MSDFEELMKSSRPRPVAKFNPNHDEGGRFASGGGGGGGKVDPNNLPQNHKGEILKLPARGLTGGDYHASSARHAADVMDWAAARGHTLTADEKQTQSNVRAGNYRERDTYGKILNGGTRALDYLNHNVSRPPGLRYGYGGKNDSFGLWPDDSDAAQAGR